MIGLLMAANFLLAVSDAYQTRRMMARFGINIELNPTVRFLAKHLGLEVGLFCGIAAPAVAQSLVFGWLKWPLALALLVGFRFKLLVNQIKTESILKQAQDSGLRLPPSKVSLPSDSGSSGEGECSEPGNYSKDDNGPKSAS